MCKESKFALTSLMWSTSKHVSVDVMRSEKRVCRTMYIDVKPKKKGEIVQNRWAKRNNEYL